MSKFNMKVTPEIEKLTQICRENDKLDLSLYGKYDVKRGLRDLNGKGVLAGLTQISNVQATKIVDGKEVPCAGKLSYRGYDIKDLTNGFINDRRFGFEEVTYLLLFGKLPDQEELNGFSGILANQRMLPRNFVRDVIMKAPSRDIMNALSRSVLTLYSYDKDPDNIELENVLRQCINLISVFPLLSVYAYQAYNHYVYYTCGFLFRDRYVFCDRGSIGFSEGPKHGGANIKVVKMFNDMRKHVHDYSDEEEISAYLKKLLHKEAFDKRGLIYGMGHAIYSVSDPRAEVFKGYVEQLAREKGRMKDYQLYAAVERLAPKVIAEERKIYKGVSANVDFYSGFVYSMLDLPLELYTPMFAIARIVGWSAHRMEELINVDKIIRPAYKNVLPEAEYIPLCER